MDGQRQKYEAPSWDYIYLLLIELGDMVKKSGFKPDVIVGIARGGWPPARVLSDFLDNPNIANVRVEFYLDIHKTIKEPVITQPISVTVKGKKILLADDVADSGKSLKLVYDRLVERGASEIKVATLYYKPWSTFKPDFYSRETEAWIIFPWERYESIKKLGGKMKGEGKSFREMEREFIKMGLEPHIVRKFLREIFGEG